MKPKVPFKWLFLFCVISVPMLQGMSCSQGEFEFYETTLRDGLTVELFYFGIEAPHVRWEGRKNKHGRWDGEVIREVAMLDKGVWIKDPYYEIATYQNGYLHGPRDLYYKNILYKREYYEHGLLVQTFRYAPFTEDQLSFKKRDSLRDLFYPATIEQLQSRKPWLIDHFNGFQFPAEFLMNYTAEVEYRLRNISVQDAFDSSFTYASWSVGYYDPYKSFYNAYSNIAAMQGNAALKDNPLRLAVLKRYETNASSTYAVLQASFPRGLLALRTLGAKPADTQFYTNQVDSYLNKINAALGAIPAQDPLFASKVDQRINTALAILDDKRVAAGGVISAKNTLGTDYYNAGNPLLDAARHGYFGETLPLTVKTQGAGMVTGEGINCGLSGSNCKEYYDFLSTVSLTANPQGGAQFTGWSGDCTGTAPSCTLKISQERLVLANFAGGASPYYLSIRQSGDGYVKTDLSGISCSGLTGTCAAEFAPGTQVTLTATPDMGAEFVGWGGGSCSGTATTCQLTMNADKTVAATFKPITPAFPLALFRDGPGNIRATAGGNLNCGNDCTGLFPVGTLITLKALPLTDAQLVTWGGACQGATETCDITIAGETFVGATFATE